MMSTYPVWWIVALVAVILLSLSVWVVRTLLVVPLPNEAVVLSGASPEGYRVVRRRVLRKPLLERVDRLSLELIPVSVRVQGAYSKGNIPLEITAVASVSVSDDPEIQRNAVERFLGRATHEIEVVARETLEGLLRGFIAHLTPEEGSGDREAVRAKFMGADASDDLEKFGLRLLSFDVLEVTDEVDHLESIGREQVAAVLRKAELSKTEGV